MHRKIIILILCLSFNVNADEPRKLFPWISPSSIWGQGNSGIAYHYSDDTTLFLRYNFVWDWIDTEYNYHMAESSLAYDDLSLGVRYRWQSDIDEYAPFIGYYKEWINKRPITLYNELEYRFSPAIRDDDYFRSRNMITLYASEEFVEKHGLRPYVAFDIFTNWREEEIEKTRLILGYRMTLGKITGKVYFIPWVDGELEEEWKDKVRFGANSVFRF